MILNNPPFGRLSYWKEELQYSILEYYLWSFQSLRSCQSCELHQRVRRFFRPQGHMPWRQAAPISIRAWLRCLAAGFLLTEGTVTQVKRLVISNRHFLWYNQRDYAYTYLQFCANPVEPSGRISQLRCLTWTAWYKDDECGRVLE